jgi:hypothetical protein
VAAFIILLIWKGVAAFRDSTVGEYQRVTRLGSFAGCVGILIHSFVDFPLRTASNAFFFLLVAALIVVPSFPVRRHRGSVNGL